MVSLCLENKDTVYFDWSSNLFPGSYVLLYEIPFCRFFKLHVFHAFLEMECFGHFYTLFAHRPKIEHIMGRLKSLSAPHKMLYRF